MKLLSEKRIIITKSNIECNRSLKPLTTEGAEIIYFPTIKTVPLFDSLELRSALDHFNKFDYLIFTSTNSVKIFSEIVEREKLDLSMIKIAAVGKSTADECQGKKINVNILPKVFSAEGLIEKFSQFDLLNKKILIPGSSLMRSTLKENLMRLGAEVISVTIYDVIENDLHSLKSEYDQIVSCKPDIFIFTSPSSFGNFITLMNVKDLPKYFENSIVCAMGQTTKDAMFEKGILANITPALSTISGIADAIIDYHKATPNI